MSAMLRLILIYVLRVYISYLDENKEKPTDNIFIIIFSFIILGLELSIGYSIFKVLGI